MIRRTSLNLFFSPLVILLIILQYSSMGGGYIRENPVYGGVFRIKPFTDEFREQLDPAQAGAFIFLMEQIYDGLVRLDDNLNVMPSLAEYWKISSDATVYTFYLKKGVRFHHGENVSAEDVKFSFQRILNKEVNSPYYHFFLDRVVGARAFREGEAEHVSGFKVLNDHTIEIHWTRPFVSSLYLLSMHFCKILPRNLVLKKGRGFFRKPSGTGPFRFDYWLRDTQLNIVGVRMKRHKDYFRGKPYVDAVEFCPLFTYDHFIRGEIDSIPVLSDKLMESDYQIFQGGPLHLTFLGMSCHIAPLDDIRVREALAYGIHKKDIVQAVEDARYLRQVSSRFVPSRLPGFFPTDRKEMFNVEKAQQRLRAGGFRSEEKFPRLTLFLEFPRSDFKIQIYRELKRQLDCIGIDLRVEYYQSMEEIHRWDKPYLVLIEKRVNIPDPGDMIRPLFFSPSRFNVVGYDNPELDHLLRETEVERSWTRRIQLFHLIERSLIKDLPAIPLYTQQNRVAMQPYVRGVEVPPLGLYYLEARKIWLIR